MPGKHINQAVRKDVAKILDLDWLGGNESSPSDIIYFDKSTNGGASFGTDMNIAQGTSPQIPITSSNVTFPSIAVDVSGGPRNGHVYVTWCDARNGDPDIFLIKSTNGGVNWSSPLRINDDAVSNGKLQCWPWIALNEEGKIAEQRDYYDLWGDIFDNIPRFGKMYRKFMKSRFG